MSIERRVRALERAHGAVEAVEELLFLPDAHSDPVIGEVLLSRTGEIVAATEFVGRYPHGAITKVLIGIDPHRI
jgi:hypothetical protein